MVTDWKDRWITVFTDASYDSTTGAWGYGVWIKYGGGQLIKDVGGGNYIKNSQEAEYQALNIALILIKKNICYRNKKLSIQSDCVQALEKLQLPGILTTLSTWKKKHVKAHQGYVNKRAAVNEWCDRVAKYQMRKFRTQNQRDIQLISQFENQGYPED